MRAEIDPRIACVDGLFRWFLRFRAGTRGRRCPRSFIRTFLLLYLAGSVLAGCSKQEKEAGSAPETEKKPEGESRVKRGTNDEVIITLDAKTQKVMGLQTAAIQAAQLRPEAKGYGHVLDPSPLTSLVADLVSAQASSTASATELKRLQALSAQNNASERALQTAQAAATRDKAQVESIRLRFLANWGSAIADRQDLSDFVQKLSSLATALVQLNLAAGGALTASPTGARLLTLADQIRPIEAQFLGPAPATDPQLQSKGFFLLVDPNAARLAVGEAVGGFLSLPGEPSTGVAVPRDAIVQFNGLYWVYIQTSDETFKRVELQPGPPLDNAIFVREGVNLGDKVITVGAQQLLSEELKGQGGE